MSMDINTMNELAKAMQAEIYASIKKYVDATNSNPIIKVETTHKVEFDGVEVRYQCKVYDWIYDDKLEIE